MGGGLRLTCREVRGQRKEAAKSLEPEPWTKMKVMEQVTVKFSYLTLMECLA